MTTLEDAAAIQAGTVEFEGSVQFVRRGENNFCVKLVTKDGVMIWRRDVIVKAGQTLVLSPLALALSPKTPAAETSGDSAS